MGFKFDKISSVVTDVTKQYNEVNKYSNSNLSVLELPISVKNKIYMLAKTVGRKKDIDRVGAYVSKKFAARLCVEVPRVLPSRLNRQLASESEEQDSSRINEDEALSQRLLADLEDKRHKINTISFTPHVAIAYTIHYFPGQYAVFARILTEIQLRADFQGQRALIYQSGFGACLAALYSVFKNQFTDVVVVEPSKNLRDISSFIMKDLLDVDSRQSIYYDDKNYDLIMLCYSLINVPGYTARDVLIKNLWNKLNKNGIIVIVETGTPTGFRMIHSIRELFIKELEKGSFHFVAPCPHEGICPLAQTGRDWCHFSQKITRISHHVYKKGSRSNTIDDEKFSYLVVRKARGPRDMYKSEFDTESTREKSYFWPRIPNLKRGKHVLLDVCTSEGYFERLAVTKSSPESFGYKFGRKGLWGDLWPFPKRLVRPEGRGYTPRRVLDYLYKTRKLAELNESSTSLSKDQFEQDQIENYKS